MLSSSEMNARSNLVVFLLFNTVIRAGINGLSNPYPGFMSTVFIGFAQLSMSLVYVIGTTSLETEIATFCTSSLFNITPIHRIILEKQPY